MPAGEQPPAPDHLAASRPRSSSKPQFPSAPTRDFFMSQAVFTPTCRLTSERSFGGRIVNQSGNTDIYLTYAQQARTGADVFFIIGNPNSATTEGLVQLKVVDPF